MGFGGLEGEELENETKQPEQEGRQEARSRIKRPRRARTKSSPAANTFRRSVRTYCPGRAATTTATTTTLPRTTTPRSPRTSRISDATGISAATVAVATVAIEAEDDCDIIADVFMRESCV